MFVYCEISGYNRGVAGDSSLQGGSYENVFTYRGADKSLARPGRKQANVSVRME